MIQPTIDELKTAVEQLHICTAFFIEDVVVVEKFGDKTRMERYGISLRLGRPPEDYQGLCLVFTNRRQHQARYYAVLHIPPVDSPEKAVRASIVQDSKHDNSKI